MRDSIGARKPTVTKLGQVLVSVAMMAAFVLSMPLSASATNAAAQAKQSLEAGDVDIAFSTSADRSGATPLDGAAISGSIYAFVNPVFPDGDIQRVDFKLDGSSTHTEFAAPYDFPARRQGAWNSVSVTDGAHTLTADVVSSDGSTVSVTASFTVSNGVAPVDSGLAYSTNSNRSNQADLNGAVVEGTVWAFVFPIFPPSQLGIQNVSFTLDGADFRTEFLAPYDFGPAAIGWDSTTVADGEHTIVATANTAGGVAFASTATFTVANDGPPPTDPTDPTDPTLGLFDTLAADGRFTTLLAAIDASDLGPPPVGFDFTLFAPTDEAFAAIPPEALDELLADTDALTEALSYHIVEGAVTEEILLTVPEVISTTGAPIGVEVVDGSVVLNGNANVIETDIMTTEVLVHVIDAVLQSPQRDFLGFLAADYARGSTEVPDPGDLSTWSQGFFELFDVDGEEHEVCVFGRTIIADPTVAHIHRGKAGESGPIVVDAGFSAESWEIDEVFPEERLAQTCVPVEAGLVAEILASPGDFYFNIHSETFPGGANREQLFDGDGPDAFPRAFTAAPLLGSNEVPGPGDPDSGRSFIDFTLPTTDNGELCFTAVLFNVDGITGAHIHEGAAGVSGDVVVDLQAVSRWRVTPETPLWHWFRGCVPVAADVLAQVEANPEGFYANFHNDAFPDGAVRAQLVEGVGEEVRFAELAPESGFDPEMNGFANTAIFPSQEQFCWEINALGVGMPTAASISGPNGVTLDLDLATHPFRAITVPWSDYTSHGCQVVDEAVLDDIVANPDSYLVSIDTAMGALSGSLFNPETGPLPTEPGPASLSSLRRG